MHSTGATRVPFVRYAHSSSSQLLSVQSEGKSINSFQFLVECLVGESVSSATLYAPVLSLHYSSLSFEMGEYMNILRDI